MDTSTLLWIGETFFYILTFFLLLIISKVIFKIRYKNINIDNELSSKDNVAFSILTTGYFIGVLIIFLGVIQGESYGYLNDLILILSYSLIGNLLLIISSFLNERVVFSGKFSLYKEIIEDKNNGTGFIEAANFIGSSLIIFGAIKGKTFNLFPTINHIGLYISGVVSLILFWSIGQIILYVSLHAYKRVSNYNVLVEIEKDNVAVGIVYASIFLSITYLYSQAIKGDLISLIMIIENICYYIFLGLILLPISRLFVDKVILPKSNLTDEIINQTTPNQGAALIEAFAYLGSAVLISYCI